MPSQHIFDEAAVHVQHKTSGDTCETLGVHRYKGKHDPTEPQGTSHHYVSLHHHSTYSYLDGYALPEAHVRRAEELEMPALALTEHGNISSHVQLEKAATGTGVKPIFGCELYMGKVGEGGTQRKNHLTVLAEDEDGYRNLMRLVSRGWEQFYYEPTVSFSDLVNFSSGLVVLSGCTGSLLATSLVGGKNIQPEDANYNRAKAVARSFQRALGDAFYLEVQAFPELEVSRKINVAYESLGQELGIRLVATGDVHYTRPSESEIQKVLHNVRGGGRQTLEEQARAWGYDVHLSPPASDSYMVRRLKGTGLSHRAAMEAIRSTIEIADRCNVILPKLPMVRFPVPHGFSNALEVWRTWIRDGWHFRNMYGKAAGDRLRHEMKVIEDKDYIDYFLIVSDMVKFAKDSGIPVGPARGSAAASLVCYLLRITEVNPLLYPDLLFERFIDVTRKDLPDIDLDFDSDRRSEIRDYLVAKYGPAQVGNIGTFTKYKSKNALDDTARVYKIPKYKVEAVKDLVVERSSGDLRASATIEDSMGMFPAVADVFREYPALGVAMDLEGNVKGMGMHAAGLVVASGPLTDVCSVYGKLNKVKGVWEEVLSVDKYDAEYLNVLKIDALGLSTMSAIRIALEYLGKPLSWLYEIRLDDPETMRGFQENDVVGVFQFDGRAMRSLCAEIKPENFQEIADINALSRPGPLHNGAAAVYIDVKKGRTELRQYHPLIWEIVKNTHGQIVYQEQILRICGEIGGFDHTHRATIRKIISRKIGEQEFNRWWQRFRAGALERGVPEEDAQRIWNACLTAGSYAFNIAHSVSYGMIAFWTMYLKRHHPQAFFLGSLIAYGPEKEHALLRDAVRHGLHIVPPDPRTSDVSWLAVESVEDAIFGGFSQVPGCGAKTAANIVAWRDSMEHEQRDYITWESLLAIKGIGGKKIQTFKDFVAKDDPFDIMKLENLIKTVVQEIKSKQLGWLPWPTHTAEQVPYSKTDQNVPVVWLGQIISRNLRELFELHFSRTGEDLDPKTVRDPELNEWVVMVGNDDTETLTVTVDRWRYEAFKERVWGTKLNSDLVLIRGHKKAIQARRAIYVEDMWILDPFDDKEETDG